MRDRFSEYVDRVEREHERIVVTRNGRSAAVLISPDDLQSLEESLAVLADSETVRGIREGQDAIRAVSTPYTVRLAGPVVRAIQHDLPEVVAGAMMGFFNGALRENPHRVGHPLRSDLAGLWRARRGSFRVIDAIDDATRIVSVVTVDHRRDVHR